jgi:hypothetical protein
MIDPTGFQVRIMALAMTAEFQKVLMNPVTAIIALGVNSQSPYKLTKEVAKLLNSPTKGYKYTNGQFLYYWDYKTMRGEFDLLVSQSPSEVSKAIWNDFRKTWYGTESPSPSETQQKDDRHQKRLIRNIRTTLDLLETEHAIRQLVAYITNTAMYDFNYDLSILYQQGDNPNEIRLFHKGSLQQELYTLDTRFTHIVAKVDDSSDASKDAHTHTHENRSHENYLTNLCDMGTETGDDDTNIKKEILKE